MLGQQTEFAPRLKCSWGSFLRVTRHASIYKITLSLSASLSFSLTHTHIHTREDNYNCLLVFGMRKNYCYSKRRMLNIYSPSILGSTISAVCKREKIKAKIMQGINSPSHSFTILRKMRTIYDLTRI